MPLMSQNDWNNIMEQKNAIGITTVTCVGFTRKEFPMQHGNCFSVETDDGKEYRIVNFGYENLKELFHRGLTYPVKITILPVTQSQRRDVAVIDDERIGEQWYFTEYCRTCCPNELLTEPQRLARERMIRAGIITVMGNCERHDYSKQKEQY